MTLAIWLSVASNICLLLATLSHRARLSGAELRLYALECELRQRKHVEFQELEHGKTYHLSTGGQAVRETP